MTPAVYALPIAAFLAGFVDAIAGGGGLITLPVLLATGIPPHTALATNKGQSTFGAITSAVTYWRRGGIDKPRAPRNFALGFVGALLGAALVLAVPREPLRPIILVLLVFAAAFVLFPRRARPAKASPTVEDAKNEVAPEAAARRGITPTLPVVLAIPLGIGFYDGFFGPGTGSLLIIAFVLAYHDDLTRASGNAKVVNLASNLAALVWFAARGTILWEVALPMAGANMLGAFVGARAALHVGDRLVRSLVAAVVLCLILKIGWDLFAI